MHAWDAKANDACLGSEGLFASASCIVCAQDAHVTSLRGWLKHVTFKPDDTSDCMRLTLSTQTMTTQLSVLCAMKIRPANRRVIQINGAIDNNAVRSLARLPVWAKCCLVFSKAPTCTWALDAAGYEALGRSVPTSYEDWFLDALKDTELLKALCAGVNSARAVLRLPRVQLLLRGHRGGKEVVGDHVVVDNSY